jgi:hypothetical protein
LYERTVLGEAKYPPIVKAGISERVFESGRAVKVEQKIRKTGIDVIGYMPWGMHICQFYRTKKDLVDILVPYFKAGLEGNEYCMWVVTEPLEVEDARSALKKKVKNLDDYVEKKQIEILERSQWYTKSGKFELDKVLLGWLDKEKEALGNGFEGLRVAGNVFQPERDKRKGLVEYEAMVDHIIGRYRMLAVCSYFFDNFKKDVVDVANHHQFILIKRDGKWTRLNRGYR